MLNEKKKGIIRKFKCILIAFVWEYRRNKAYAVGRKSNV